ncbi:hypothetical protein J6590_023002 [Homalodisca vitripennis]|nr:hypothetical protein J6590_023002 [Homalodisca vitripennis]
MLITHLMEVLVSLFDENGFFGHETGVICARYMAVRDKAENVCGKTRRSLLYFVHLLLGDCRFTEDALRGYETSLDKTLLASLAQKGHGRPASPTTTGDGGETHLDSDYRSPTSTNTNINRLPWNHEVTLSKKAA